MTNEVEQAPREVLRGGVAVVVGGAGTSAGLGQGLARRFAEAGMRVAIVDIDDAAARSVAADLRAEGHKAVAFVADVRAPDSLRAAAEGVQAELGTVNVLCAHVGGGGQGRVAELPLGVWRDSLELMVLGTVSTVQAFLPLLRSTEGVRRIVLTASAAALAPGRYQGPYRAAKAAVTSLGETLDLELGAEGIGTTIVFPSGMMPPDIVEMRRAAIESGVDLFPAGGEELDVLAAVAVEMASDMSDVVSGYDAAGPVVAGVAAGRRYIISHGATVEHHYRARQEILEQAFTDLARRNYLPGSELNL